MTETIAPTTTIHLNGSGPTKGPMVAVGSKRCHLGEIIPTSHLNGSNGSAMHSNGSNGSYSSNGSAVHSSGLNVNGSAGVKNSFSKNAGTSRCLWFEEELEDDLRWFFGVSKILHCGVSDFQDIQLVESRPFGKVCQPAERAVLRRIHATLGLRKLDIDETPLASLRLGLVLLLDGKLQSAEKDEFLYHESLVHPACLFHGNPKSVFIMGGGEGSTAREVLKHRSMKKVVMCDIDEEVVDFCRKHLPSNSEAFRSRRLELVIDCARAELERRQEQFDIIIGDLADPVDGGPCFKLYTESFYESVLKPKLAPGGILVTQAGPAGILSHKVVYSSIFNTLRQVFKYVVPYAGHVPSYADTWGWIMASDHPFPQFNAAETDFRIAQRVTGELRFLDGATVGGLLALNKQVRTSIYSETHVYTEETARFIHGHGTGPKHAH